MLYKCYIHVIYTCYIRFTLIESNLHEFNRRYYDIVNTCTVV